jgi:hypothetical protein
LLDNIHLQDLIRISEEVTRDNVGDIMSRAVVYKGAIANLDNLIVADRIFEKIRSFARKADIGWKIFEQPIMPTRDLSSMQVWQLISIAGTLVEINYCFERIEDVAYFTFENSAPVRFYVNGIFHYVSALFLLDYKNNRDKNLPYPGTVIKALHPLGLTQLLDPVYQVLNRSFGKSLNYGETILKNRNKQFVHGSFSPESIKDLVADSDIFDNVQKERFIQNHWDLYNRLILLRLRLLSILTALDVSFEKYPPQKIFHMK